MIEKMVIAPPCSAGTTMLKNFLLFTCILIASTLTACAPMKHNYTPQIKHLDFPGLNTQTTVYVGDVMLAQGSALESDVLENKSHISGACYDIPPGLYQKKGEDGGRTYFSHVGDMGQVTWSGICDPVVGMYVPATNDKICVVNRMGGYLCYEGDFIIKKMGIASTAHIQKKLAYSGSDGSTISFMYTERNGTQALMTHNVSYNVKDDKVIAYRGARIKILAFSKDQISYEVLQGFRE